MTGMGASNNHLGMVESSNVTQQMAIRASFRDIPYGPDAVDLVECHATSTRQGDVEEARALKAVFNSSKTHRDHLIQIPDWTHTGRLGSLITSFEESRP